MAFTLSGDKLTARVGSRSDNELSVMISLVCGRGGLVPDEGLALQTLGQSGQFGWILEHHDIPLHLHLQYLNRLRNSCVSGQIIRIGYKR